MMNVEARDTRIALHPNGCLAAPFSDKRHQGGQPDFDGLAMGGLEVGGDAGFPELRQGFGEHLPNADGDVAEVDDLGGRRGDGVDGDLLGFVGAGLFGLQKGSRAAARGRDVDLNVRDFTRRWGARRVVGAPGKLRGCGHGAPGFPGGRRRRVGIRGRGGPDGVVEGSGAGMWPEDDLLGATLGLAAAAFGAARVPGLDGFGAAKVPGAEGLRRGFRGGGKPLGVLWATEVLRMAAGAKDGEGTLGATFALA